MRYGNMPYKIEKLAGESGFFYRHDPKVGHFSYIFPNFLAVFLCMRIPENCKDYGVIYGPENHILRHVAAEFLFVFIKT